MLGRRGRQKIWCQGAGRAAVMPIEMVSNFLKVVRGREPDGAEVEMIADKLHAAEVADDRT